MRLRTAFGLSILLTLVLGVFAPGCKKKKDLVECDYALPQCPDGLVCQYQGFDLPAYCLDPCNPNDASTCDDYAATTCFGRVLGLFSCVPNCDVKSPVCPTGKICQPIGVGKSPVCLPPCDPKVADSCSAQPGTTCERRTDGSYGCYTTVTLRGQVTDAITGAPIGNARVIAADDTGAAATNVAITDAEGNYTLQVPVTREPDGTLAKGVFTLRVAAADYLPFPYGVRPALPIDATKAVEDGETHLLVLQNATTDVTLLPLPDSELGRPSISGHVVVTTPGQLPGGVLVVAEGAGDSTTLYGFADQSGSYVIFNVPAGSYTVRGYRVGIQLTPVPLSVADLDLVDVDLNESSKALATLSGKLSIVDASGSLATSVVLIPKSLFNDVFKNGQVPAGLRAPAPPEVPSIRGDYQIVGVPDGVYMVLAAFENDKLVRDPDPGIAGTQIREVTVDTTNGTAVTVPGEFKVTEALHVIAPGATEPEMVTGNPTFEFSDDSQQDGYYLYVYDAFGNKIWEKLDIGKITGSDVVSVPYQGPALIPGMYYQFRVTSIFKGNPISNTEDLLGVFFLPLATP
ncbi:MAG: hypothetical protein KC609_11185 [Myxococcales bacterium]|nr:hypothetical protein [Myxococcales bacterium]